MSPLIALEFVSGDGEEERDRTPLLVSAEGTTQKPGTFWVYEQIVHIPYYGIYEIKNGRSEAYHLIDFTYQPLQPNERGHYPIPLLEVELRLWQGTYQNQEQLWLRWWDNEGNLLLIGSERVELEKQIAERERQRAEQEQQSAVQAERRVAQLAERLWALGIDPNEI